MAYKRRISSRSEKVEATCSHVTDSHPGFPTRPDEAEGERPQALRSAPMRWTACTTSFGWNGAACGRCLEGCAIVLQGS